MKVIELKSFQPFISIPLCVKKVGAISIMMLWEDFCLLYKLFPVHIGDHYLD